MNLAIAEFRIHQVNGESALALIEVVRVYKIPQKLRARERASLKPIDTPA